MRTTLTLDPDVALKLSERMKTTQKSLKAVVNEAIRIGLQVPSDKPAQRFVVQPHPLGLRPGIDPDKLNQYLDELEVEDFVRKSES